MTPDIGMRLGTIARALQQVVIPALAADQVLAIEQATMCLGHLGIIGEQLGYVADYEASCLADMTALAADLVAASAGGAHTQEATEELRDLVNQAGSSPDDVSATVKNQRNALAGGIDRLIRASGRDGDADFLAASQNLVLEHGTRQSFRDRAWFRGYGLDPDRASLPSIPELLEQDDRQGEHSGC
jgi:hypothetical protein